MTQADRTVFGQVEIQTLLAYFPVMFHTHWVQNIARGHF